MIGTESKLVSMSASWARVAALPRAGAMARPVGVRWIGFKTTNVAWLLEWMATGPDSVTVREATWPLITSSIRISPGWGRNLTAIDCSTVLRPRTGRPRMKSCTGALETVLSGSIRSTKPRCTASLTLGAR